MKIHLTLPGEAVKNARSERAGGIVALDKKRKEVVDRKAKFCKLSTQLSHSYLQQG